MRKGIHPEKITENSYTKHPNANKKWTRKEERILLNLYYDGKSVKYIAYKQADMSKKMLENNFKEGDMDYFMVA